MRCAKRALVCEYFITRRAGRTSHATNTALARASGTLAARGSRPCDAPNVALASPALSSINCSGTGNPTSLNLVEVVARQYTPAYTDIFPDLLSTAHPDSCSTLPSPSADFDDFFTSLVSFPMPDASGSGTPAQSQLYFSNVNNGLSGPDAPGLLLSPGHAFSGTGETARELPTFTTSRSPPPSQPSASSDAERYQGLCSKSPCCCIVRALGFLQQLCQSTASTSCTSSGGQDHYNDVTRPLATVHSIVAENAQIIPSVSKMLHCPCSRDGYLLSIISLVVFKILDWYAAAAAATSVGDGQASSTNFYAEHRPPRHLEPVLPSPTNTVASSSYPGGGGGDSDDEGRMAAQLVLRELHRVQRLINLLSQRLKCRGTRDGTTSTPSGDGDSLNTLSNREESMSSPFSATMLEQLELDLRTRLRALSSNTVDVLRRG